MYMATWRGKAMARVLLRNADAFLDEIDGDALSESV